MTGPHLYSENVISNPVGNMIHFLVFLAHFALLAGLYSQTFSHDFVYFDDDSYVLLNDVVRTGLTWDGVLWAFTTFQVANWHPLTWLSYMLDSTFFGVQPGWYLLHNVLLHGINSLLVYALLLRLVHLWWPAALGSLIFLVHPLHVESVAWIAERKDVLSGLFYLLGLLAYDRWHLSRRAREYWLVVVCCALALLAKPMAVTFPVALVLFDIFLYRRGALASIIEKWPMFLMSLGAGLLTIRAQDSGGALSGFDLYPAWWRLSTAANGYVTYLYDFVLPQNLAAFYPLQNEHSVFRLLLHLVLLATIILVCFACRNRYKFLALGLSFYFVTLLPVIGLVQVGAQSHADRYMYLPSLGLLIAMMELPKFVASQHRRFASGIAMVMLCFYSVLCYWQVGYWQNRETLFLRVLAVSGSSYVTHINLATGALERKDYHAAIQHAGMATELEPHRYRAQIILGDAALRLGDVELAEQYYLEAASKSMESSLILNRVGVLWAVQGRLAEAVSLFERALEIHPEYYDARINLEKYGAMVVD